MADQKNTTNCELCALNVGRNPFVRIFDGEEKSFCCLGCLNVYAILVESGVIASGRDIRETEIFKRSQALGLISNGNQREENSPSSIPPDAATRETLLQVSGMWCSSCAWLIEHALSGERGVVSAEAYFASDLVKVKYCPQFLPPDRIKERINKLGYLATEYTGDHETANAERRDLLLRMGIAGFLWLNIMTLSTALYVGYFEQIADSVRRFLPFVLMGLATPVVFYSAMPILKLAWRGLLNRIVRMETLLGLGILTAYLYSAVQAFTGGEHVYFDTASAIVTLVLAGKLIERGARERTSKAVSLLYRMMPKKVRMLDGGGEEKFVSVDALNVGDVFVVKAGERIPADGEIIEGSSHADESLLTGESTPIEKAVGSNIVGGSLNIGNVIKVRASKVGNETTLSQIIKLVENALGSKSELERTVDRISRVFVPGVVLVATLTLLVCWLGGFTDSAEALMRAVTILVIACPCALGMATPLAVTAAIGNASRRGILVSDSRVLETIRKVDTVVFDKTGTITDGKFALLDFQPVFSGSAAHSYAGVGQGFSLQSGGQFESPPEFSGDEAWQLIASLELYSEHPLARSVVEHARSKSIELSEAVNVEIRKGLGIAGFVDGHRVFVGNRRLAEEEGVIVTPAMARQAEAREIEGRTVAFLGWDSQLRGMLVFGDRVKPEAAEIIADLKQRGVKTMIVSGDAQVTTASVARLVEADDFIAEALPNDKTAIVHRLQKQRNVVAMIGDGVNDAPALAAADLGIAVGSGADIAMKAAAVVLMSSSLNKLLDVFDLANKTWRIVRQNLFWAFFYNTLGISLAITGMLNPIFAAGAMLISSLSVIGNSLRLNRQ